MTQQRSHFFLDVDDEVRLTQIFGQTCVLAAQLLVLLIHRMALGLGSALLRSQRLQDAVGPLAPPIGQQGRVQTFAVEKCSHSAPALRAPLLSQNRPCGPRIRLFGSLSQKPRSSWSETSTGGFAMHQRSYNEVHWVANHILG